MLESVRQVGAGAAHHAPVRPVLEDQTRVRAREVAGPQLVEGGVNVRVPGFLVQGLAVEVGRGHELAEVGGLLDLEDQRTRPEGVDDPTRHVDGVAGPDRVPRHHRVVIFGLERLEELVAAQALPDAGDDRGVRGGPEDVPGLGLAVGGAVHATRGLVVGVEVDREHVRGVEELEEEREVRAAPALADEFVRELVGEVVQDSPLVGAVRDRSGRVLVVAHLPGLGDYALRDVAFAEVLGDQALPEVVGADVVGELYRVRLHGTPPCRLPGSPSPRPATRSPQEYSIVAASTEVER